MYRINNQILENKGLKIKFHENWYPNLKSTATNQYKTILVRIIERILFFKKYWPQTTWTGPWTLDPIFFEK